MKFNIVPTLAYVCLVSLLLVLGIWQLGRSEEKRAFLNLQEQGARSGTLPWSIAIEENADALRYKKVQVAGRYDSAHQFLIDNQMSDGKAGYFVLTPFLLARETKAVLVNRGWIPLTANRAILPDVQVNTLPTLIIGRINNFPGVGIKLAGADVPSESWPSVVQVVNSQQIAKKLGYPVLPFQIEMDKELPDGFKREWRTYAGMLPEQHIAYAIQWFALALTLTILFIVYSFKKNDD